MRVGVGVKEIERDLQEHREKDCIKERVCDMVRGIKVKEER